MTTNDTPTAETTTTKGHWFDQFGECVDCGQTTNDTPTTPTTTRTYFAAGHNMPGYMPEADVAYFDTFEDAKAYMISEMERDADSYDDTARTDGIDGEDADQMHTLADELASEQQDLNLDNGPEWGTIVGNVSYWITVTEEAPDDDDLY